MYRYIKLNGIGFKVIRDLTPDDEEISLQEYIKIRPPDRYEFAGITGKVETEDGSVRSVFTRNAAWLEPYGYVDGEANKYGESVTAFGVGSTNFRTDKEKAEWAKKNPKPLSDWRTPNGTVGWW